MSSTTPTSIENSSSHLPPTTRNSPPLSTSETQQQPQPQPQLTTTTTAAAPSSDNNSSSTGIDISQALSILAARTECDHSSHDPDHATTHNHGIGSCHGTTAPEGAKAMGQVIDLADDDSTEVASERNKEDSTVIDVQEQLAKEQERLQRERAERRKKIQAELETMSVKELLQTVLKTQEDRVATYKKYDAALEDVLSTGNMTLYPDSCAQATASFSVLSETIKFIQEFFAGKMKKKDLSALLKNLQELEKEKLHLTAAYHLERIRQRNQEQLPEELSDPRIENLLAEGVASMKQKIGVCIQDINEILDEVRMTMLEDDV